MSSPEKTKNPLQQLSEATAENPGMYLIALRAHLKRGKTIICDVFDTVTDALPKPAKLGNPEQS